MFKAETHGDRGWSARLEAHEVLLNNLRAKAESHDTLIRGFDDRSRNELGLKLTAVHKNIQDHGCKHLETMERIEELYTWAKAMDESLEDLSNRKVAGDVIGQRRPADREANMSDDSGELSKLSQRIRAQEADIRHLQDISGIEAQAARAATPDFPEAWAVPANARGGLSALSSRVMANEAAILQLKDALGEDEVGSMAICDNGVQPCSLAAHALEAGSLATYLVDNSVLQNKNVHGVSYRLSKNLEDRASHSAAWGSIVAGHDEGDGWLKVGDKYLPIVFSNVQILIPQTGAPPTSLGQADDDDSNWCQLPSSRANGAGLASAGCRA
jgi:hypothetical protein